MHPHRFTSMVIRVVDRLGVFTVKDKGNPPVTAYLYSPRPSSLTMELV